MELEPRTQRRLYVQYGPRAHRLVDLKIVSQRGDVNTDDSTLYRTILYCSVSDLTLLSYGDAMEEDTKAAHAGCEVRACSGTRCTPPQVDPARTLTLNGTSASCM
jgi:hypothetical protein